MEQAFYATSLKGLKGAAGEYSRVYFGAEFCQWRMPGPAGLRKALDIAKEKGLRFTLMTPWVTDAGIKRLKALLAVLSKAEAPGSEVVVNDYGVLTVVKENFPSLTPVLGRLLVKQKCCPRIPGMFEDIPEAGRDIYLHTAVEDPEAARFLRKWGVKRVELDNPMQGMRAELKGAGMKGSIYVPYAYVTTTRHCPASFDGDGWQSFTGCTVKGCLKTVIALHSPAHGARILMRGNTQFVENESLPKGLGAMGIDRVVRMEDVP
jgi:hypothetical protein